MEDVLPSAVAGTSTYDSVKSMMTVDRGSSSEAFVESTNWKCDKYLEIDLYYFL